MTIYYRVLAHESDTLDGDGRYLVGRMHENGDREPVTCVITVEQEEVDDEDDF